MLKPVALTDQMQTPLAVLEFTGENTARRVIGTRLLQAFRVAVLFTFFCACIVTSAGSIEAQTAPPILLSDQNSTRAIAFESITFTKEPFPLSSLISWSPDTRTRIMLFAINLPAQPALSLADFSVDAQDVLQRHYDLKLESAAAVVGQEWMTALTVRLSDQMDDAGDVLVRVTYKGRASNRVRIGIGHLGGGPPDDAGAKPTSPYFIRGKVTADSSGLAGAEVTLRGNGVTYSDITDNNGDYSILTVGGDYDLSVSKPFYDFAPLAKSLNNLSQALDGVDFVAVRQMRDIYAVLLDDHGQIVSDAEMTLTSNNFSTQKATTGNTGIVAFNVPAGFAYTLTGKHKIFAFTPQSIDSLGGNTTLTFSGVRREYTVSGRVKDRDAGVADATVKLQETGAVAISDAAGNYSFSGLTAGFDYTILVSREEYVFEPSSFSVPQLDGDRQLDIQGTPHVFLTGRVVDQNGHGIFGVKINISGTQSGVAATKADGSYSFLVTAFGNFVLSPQKEQDYYNFTPTTATLTAAKNNRVADFNGLINASVSPSYVLEFDGSRKTVDYSTPNAPPDYNLFWPDGEEFGHFFWEFWAMPGENAGATYLISDGYGGAHAILFGFTAYGSRSPNRYQLLGNIWNGQGLTYFLSDEGPAPYEWGHFAAGWDGKDILIYYNGVPVGATHWIGPRVTPGGIQGCGRLLIGGSDHANLIGRIAQVRGYERNNPHETANDVYDTFVPETVFAVDGNLLSYFFRPAQNIADLSLFGQYGRQHTGVLRGTANGVLQPCNGCPVPQFVIDPTAPDFAHPNNPGTISAPPVAQQSVPAGALIFDSFSRGNSTYVLSGLGGLGSTEGGASGVRTWQTDQAPTERQPFGILNGRAVLLARAPAVAWTNVPGGVFDLNIGIDRGDGAWGAGRNTGLSFRVLDSRNYFFAYSSDNVDPSQPQTLTVGYYLDGVRTYLISGLAMPASWTTLRVVTYETGELSVFAGGSLLYSADNDLLRQSSGAGLYNNGAGLALTNRWDNFRVFHAP